MITQVLIWVQRKPLNKTEVLLLHAKRVSQDMDQKLDSLWCKEITTKKHHCRVVKLVFCYRYSWSISSLNSGNKYIFVGGDYFTRWVEATAVPEFFETTVAEKLVFIFFSQFGVPLDLQSDQHPNYESTLFKEVCKPWMSITRSSAYHPSSNGMCETFNRTLLDMITVYSCTHESTGYIPNLLMLGREVHLPIEVALGAVADPQPYPGESQYVAQLQDKILTSSKFVRNSFKMQIQKDNDPRIT